ncbi:MAG: hypothetical protein P1U46_04105 [Patescibacteria group bacterium]|nr:hypothetical protein [Patescibacteria group bacterium]
MYHSPFEASFSVIIKLPVLYFLVSDLLIISSTIDLSIQEKILSLYIFQNIKKMLFIKLNL